MFGDIKKIQYNEYIELTNKLSLQLRMQGKISYSSGQKNNYPHQLKTLYIDIPMEGQ
jgi:hypothetical protein